MTTRDGSPLGPDCPARGDTRRAFLIRLAKSTAFVPPLMLTYEIALAQGPGGGGPPGKISKTKSTTATFTVDPAATTATPPPPGIPESSTYGGTPPWARKPPGGK